MTHLVSSSHFDGLSCCSVVDVAGHILRGNVLERIVVWWTTNVSSGGVSDTLIDIVDERIPDGGMGIGKSYNSSAGEES